MKPGRGELRALGTRSRDWGLVIGDWMRAAVRLFRRRSAVGGRQFHSNESRVAASDILNSQFSILNFFALFIFFAVPLSAASDYTWQMEVSKTEAFVKEPIVLTFSVEQTDRSNVMFFDFKPLEEGRWKAIRLDKKIDDGYHHRKAVFTYLLFPLESGELTLRFDLLVKVTNDEAIARSTTGGRYNVRDVKTWDRHDAIPSRTFRIDSLPGRVDLVGDFTMKERLDRHEIEAFHPVYLTLELEGVGYPPPEDPLPIRIDGVEIFADKPRISMRYDRDGAHYKGVWSYALVAERDFTIPALTLEAFSPRKRRRYTLHYDTRTVHVVRPARKELVDIATKPESAWESVEALKRWGIDLLIFLSGYLTAWLAGRARGLLTGWGERSDFARAVKEAKDAKALLALLSRTDPRRYAPWIEELERAVYKGGEVDLKRVRKEVLKHG